MLFLVILIVLPVPSNLLVTGFLAESTRLIRTPAEVYSRQPVLVFAYAPSAKNVELDVSVTIRAETNFSELASVLPSQITIAKNISALPTPWEAYWYMAYIPGLPSKTTIFSIKLPLRTVIVNLTITSSVLYKLVVDGVVVASDSYVVKSSEPSQHLPPLVYALIYDALSDLSVVNETLGLGPKGWVVGGGESVKVLVVALDEEDRPEVSFEYRVSEGAWIPTPATDSVFMSGVDELVTKVNDAIGSVEDVVKRFNIGIELPRARLTARISEVVIPPQSPGTYVMFRALAKDVDGNVMMSPTGFYYVVNKDSDTRILIIDPRVWLWLFKENLMSFEASLKSSVDYSIPSEVITPLQIVRNSSRIIQQYVVQFHHWEYLGKYYNIYVVWPKSSVVEVLRDFRPGVIILSDLGLGVKYGGAWNWDLRDIVVEGKPLLEHIVSYVKQNHAGVIATHSTLSDEIVWLSCGSRVKLGARGHVGYDLNDVDVMDEKTVASLLGMPELALWEYVRDKVAETLCNLSKTLSSTQPQLAATLMTAAVVVGSTPLQVPHIPWNGTLKATPEARDSGWDLPEAFVIEMPTLTSELGFKAYTEVGWQLAFPRVLAYVAWGSASKARGDFAKLRDRLGALYEKISSGVVKAQNISAYLDRAVEEYLRNFYHALNSALIRGTAVNISTPIPEISRNLSLVVGVGDKALSSILQRLPAKIIALSPDGLAGIIVHDKYWDPDGYRAVYFSFEVEAGKGSIVEKLLVNAVEWVKKWRYLNITELLGDLVRVPRDVAMKYKDVVTNTPGREVISKALLMNEEGGNEIELNLPPGTLHLVVAHPTTDTIYTEVVKGSAEIVNVTKVDTHITHVVIKIKVEEAVVLSLRAGSSSSLNSAYITARHTLPTETTTPTTTPTTPTTKYTETPAIVERGTVTAVAVVAVIIAVISYLMLRKRQK